MSKQLLVYFAFLVAITFTAALSSAAGDETKCTAPARWFQLPPVESDYREPMRGNECEFYRFAWQTFLYLVQPNESESLPKFLSFHTPDQLFGAAAAPRFPALSRLDNAPTYRLLLTPRLEKKPEKVPGSSAPAADTLGSVLQASSHSTLVDQNGRAVYYAQHVNKRFEDFIHKFIRDPTTGVVDPSKLQTIAAWNGFPEGCIELKTSWKIAAPGDENSFFTTDAGIAPFKVGADGENLEIDPDPMHVRPARVALVGMHVVATTVNHAEFIWATFEHIDNAPPAAFDLKDNQPVDITRSWTFYSKGALFRNCNAGNRKQVRFKNGSEQGVKDQILVVTSGEERVTQVCGSFAFGSAPQNAGDGAKPDEDVAALNESVLAQMTKDGATAKRFGNWKNYRLRGAVWIDNPDDFAPDRNFFQLDEASNPNKPFGEGKVLRGEHRLSNPTMETFTQGKVGDYNTQNNSNCFSCHTTTKSQPEFNPNNLEMPPKLVNVSHIVVNGLLYTKQAQAPVGGK
jgi:hypothetical protein